MSETIRIIDQSSNDYKIIRGIQTQGLLARLSNLDGEEKEVLVNEAEKILSKCIRPGVKDNTTGIVIGYVQSGKTLSFTTLTTLAVDNGFRVIIYFAGIKVNLLQQTTKRLKKELATEGENSRCFKVFTGPEVEGNDHIRIKNALGLNDKPAILITVLKHFGDIKALTKIFQTPEVSQAIGASGVLIIDDEADQASLNTYARKNSKTEDWAEDEYSSTYASILNLRAALPNHSYIQYTATPQGPLLVNIMDLLSPKFHVVLTPGKTYTGGKTFFEDNDDLILRIPDKEVYHYRANNLADCPESLINALQVFLLSVAIVVNIQKKERFLSMMVHADREQDANRKFDSWVRNLVESWGERLTKPVGDPSRAELIAEFKENYEEAIKRIKNPPTFADVISEVMQVTLDINIQLVIQKTKAVREIDWSQYRAHILVGADMLNRGYTIEGLNVSYMPRYSIGKSNADTIQQRCRFFGYKQNYLDSCRVYLPKDSILEYAEYVKHEEIMRSKLRESTLEKFEQLLVLDGSMNPTRNNILSVDLVRQKLCGWRQMNVLQNIDENANFVRDFVANKKFTNYKDFGTRDRNHRFIKVDIKTVMGFLKDFKISNMPDALRKSSTIQYLRYLADRHKVDHAYIFEMAFAVEEGRGRALLRDNGQKKISNIFSGRSPGGAQQYPGDKGILFEDSFCVQIHKVRLEDTSLEWDKKIVYTLGIYYPEMFSHTFIGSPRG